jgi:hypothetical protein
MTTRIASVLLLVACSSPAPDRRATEDLQARKAKLAARLSADLEQARLDGHWNGWVQERHDLGDATFPVLSASAHCDGNAARVSYNPYDDHLVVQLAKESAIEEQLRTVSLNRKRFSSPRPFHERSHIVTLTDSKSDPIDDHGRHIVVEKLTKMFAANKPVELKLGGTSMIAEAVDSSTFRWRSHTHRGWRVKLHLFSREMSKEIYAHAAIVKRAISDLAYLDTRKADVSNLRDDKDPKSVAVVKRFDELYAKAQQARTSAGDAPHIALRDSMSLEHDPPCRELAARR